MVANRNGATGSLRASATIPRLRERPSRALTQSLNHTGRALSGWCRSQRQAIRTGCFRSIALPALPSPWSCSTPPLAKGTGASPAGLASCRRLRSSL